MKALRKPEGSRVNSSQTNEVTVILRAHIVSQKHKVVGLNHGVYSFLNDQDFDMMHFYFRILKFKMNLLNYFKIKFLTLHQNTLGYGQTTLSITTWFSPEEEENVPT